MIRFILLLAVLVYVTFRFSVWWAVIVAALYLLITWPLERMARKRGLDQRDPDEIQKLDLK